MLYSLFQDYTFKEQIKDSTVRQYQNSNKLSSEFNFLLKERYLIQINNPEIDEEGNYITEPQYALADDSGKYEKPDGQPLLPILEENLRFLYRIIKDREMNHNDIYDVENTLRLFLSYRKNKKFPREIMDRQTYDFSYSEIKKILDEYAPKTKDAVEKKSRLEVTTKFGAYELPEIKPPYQVYVLPNIRSVVETLNTIPGFIYQGKKLRWCVDPHSSHNRDLIDKTPVEGAYNHANRELAPDRNKFNRIDTNTYLVLKEGLKTYLLNFTCGYMFDVSDDNVDYEQLMDLKHYWGNILEVMANEGMFRYLYPKEVIAKAVDKILPNSGENQIIERPILDLINWRSNEIGLILIKNNLELLKSHMGLTTTPENLRSAFKDILLEKTSSRINNIDFSIKGKNLEFQIPNYVTEEIKEKVLEDVWKDIRNIADKSKSKENYIQNINRSILDHYADYHPMKNEIKKINNFYFMIKEEDLEKQLGEKMDEKTKKQTLNRMLILENRLFKLAKLVERNKDIGRAMLTDEDEIEYKGRSIPRDKFRTTNVNTRDEGDKIVAYSYSHYPFAFKFKGDNIVYFTDYTYSRSTSKQISEFKSAVGYSHSYTIPSKVFKYFLYSDKSTVDGIIASFGSVENISTLDSIIRYTKDEELDILDILRGRKDIGIEPERLGDHYNSIQGIRRTSKNLEDMRNKLRGVKLPKEDTEGFEGFE
jgi:hypothetical protein